MVTQRVNNVPDVHWEMARMVNLIVFYNNKISLDVIVLLLNPFQSKNRTQRKILTHLRHDTRNSLLCAACTQQWQGQIQHVWWVRAELGLVGQAPLR